jgi:hypothetical protein
MNTTPTLSPAYIAWWRASRLDRWDRLAVGATHDEATNRMLDALAERKGGESIVLPRGRHPNQTAARGRVR